MCASSLARTVLHRQRRFISLNLIFTCLASTSSKHPFPFPHHSSPTPHEIFHLPRSASQDEIKARCERLFPLAPYPVPIVDDPHRSFIPPAWVHRPLGPQPQDYELVKVYHPDVVHAQHDVSPAMRTARFRAISHAYGVLRGRNDLSSNRSTGTWDYRDETIRAELRRRSRRSRSSTTSATDSVRHENTDDTQVWYTLMALVLVGIITAMGSVSSHLDRVERHTQSAAANLAQARAEAQLHGMERRRKIRERVRSFHDGRETVDQCEDFELHATLNGWQAEHSRQEMGVSKGEQSGGSG